MVFTRNYVKPVPHGNNGPDDHLGHRRYDSMITTRDCILSLNKSSGNVYDKPFVSCRLVGKSLAVL